MRNIFFVGLIIVVVFFVSGCNTPNTFIISGDEVSNTTVYLNSSGNGTTNYIVKFLNGTGGIIGDSIIYDDGISVGIGTTTPTQKLDVNGTINISNADSALYSPQICLAGSCKTGWDSMSTAGGWTNTSTTTSTSLNVNITTGNLTIPNGRIGIGTSNPKTTLHIIDTDRITMRFEDTSISNIPFTALVSTSTVGQLNQLYTSNGGLALQGLTNGNSYSAFVFDGMVGGTAPTVAALNFRGWKYDGAGGRTAMTGSQTIASFLAGAGTSMFDIKVDGISVPTGKVGIGTSTPTVPLEVSKNVSGMSAVFYGNITATGYNIMSTVYDKNKGSALDKINDADYYIKDGELDHKAFYGYAGTVKEVDKSNPIIKYYNVTECIEDVFDDLVCNITLHNITSYPYFIEHDIVSVNMELDVLRQAVYEIKAELCIVGKDVYEWC